MARCALVVLLLIIVTGCGQAASLDDADSNGRAAIASSPATTPSVAATTSATATLDVQTDVDRDRMIAAALEYLDWREAIRAGEPEVRLAVPAIPSTIQELGLNIGNWDPECALPMYLVVLEGDFDGRNLFVSPSAESQLTGQYVALVFDLASGVPGNVAFTILSRDGSAFKQALGDPALPDPVDDVPASGPPYPPCEDVTVEGAPQESASPTP